MNPSKFTDPEYLRSTQYRDASNLNARGNLHARFSTNPYGWFRWVFDQLEFPQAACLLELGCGPGGLWQENQERIPPGVQFALTDLSNGMVENARKNLADKAAQFSFAVADAQNIQFPASSFDLVVANHMLYHVPERTRAFAEIRRVLKPGGRLYAATNGLDHMVELDELAAAFASQLYLGAAAPEFNLENGAEQLAPWFSQVEMRLYEDALAVTEVDPLVAYVRSMMRFARDFTEEEAEGFRAFVQWKMTEDGVIHIRKSPCLFVAHC